MSLLAWANPAAAIAPFNGFTCLSGSVLTHSEHVTDLMPASSATVHIAATEQLVISVNNGTPAITGSMSVGGQKIIDLPGKRSATLSGPLNATITSPGIDDPGNTFTINFHCSDDPKPPPPTAGNAKETANHLLGLNRDLVDLVYGGDGGTPSGLPDSSPRSAKEGNDEADADPDAIARQLNALEAEIEQLQRILTLERAQQDAGLPGRLSEVEENDIENRIDDAEREIRRLEADVEIEKELGDGEAILYAPAAKSPATKVPWPMAYGEGGQDLGSPLAAAFDRQLLFNGTPVKIWTRLQGGIVDGSLDRSGAGGAVTFGVVAGVTPRLDLGVYGTGFTGSIESDALQTSVDMSGGGVGAYAKYDLPGGGEAGISAIQLWGASASDVGGVTGSYDSTFTRIDASAHYPFSVNGWIFTPASIVSWKRYADESFVDSSGASIPSADMEQVVFSAALSAARPLVVGGERLERLTPRVQVQGNWVAGQSASPIPVGGIDLLTAHDLSLDLTSGIDVAFHGAGVLSFSLGVAGIGADAQSYRATANFKLPLK